MSQCTVEITLLHQLAECCKSVRDDAILRLGDHYPLRTLGNQETSPPKAFMTLGVTSSALADRDNHFSKALRTHAQSLSLVDVMPVGDWQYGQGIRKARDNQFFWELSSRHYSPLGLNHPVALGAQDTQDLAPQPFSPELLKSFPQLATWKWTLLANDHEWMKRDWKISSAWKKQSGQWLMEDATLKSQYGWQGFEELSTLQGWAVQLNPSVSWVSSHLSLPENKPGTFVERALMRVFLSADVLSPEGRLTELQKMIAAQFQKNEVQGLNVKIYDTSASLLSSRGLSIDELNERTIGLCFPLSFLPEDLVGIANILKMKG